MSADAKIWTDDDGGWHGLHDGPCLNDADPDQHKHMTVYGLSDVIASIETCMRQALHWDFRTYSDGRVGLVGWLARSSAGARKEGDCPAMTDELFARLVSNEPVVEIRGDELRALINGIPDSQRWVDGSQLRDYLRSLNPTVIRAVRPSIRVAPRHQRDPIHQPFGYVMGRDWYVGEDAGILGLEGD